MSTLSPIVSLLNNNLTNHNPIPRTNQPNDFATILKNAQDKQKNKARLKEVSYELEAIFINMLLKQMRVSVHKTPLFHGGYAEEIFEDMLYDEYAKLIAKSDHFGLAKQIYNQFKKQRGQTLIMEFT